MAGFNAATAVEPLNYDFSAFEGPVGVVPEPSTKQVNAYFDEVKALAKEVQASRAAADAAAKSVEEDEMTEAKAQEVLATVQEGDINGYDTRMSELTADLCSGSPTLKQIDALPFRVRFAFMQWVVQSLRPDPQQPAGKR